MSFLTVMELLPLVGAALIATVGKEKVDAIKKMAFITTLLVAVAGIALALQFQGYAPDVLPGKAVGEIVLRGEVRRGVGDRRIAAAVRVAEEGGADLRMRAVRPDHQVVLTETRHQPARVLCAMLAVAVMPGWISIFSLGRPLKRRLLMRTCAR